MTNLTEQFKKGELPEGWYYVKKNGEIEMLEYNCGVFLSVDVPLDEDEISEVLAEVPTYEEWQQLKEFADYSIHNRDELTRQINFWMEENTQLKSEYEKECHRADELEDSYWKAEDENIRLKYVLKECREILSNQKMYGIGTSRIRNAVILIDEVLK